MDDDQLQAFTSLYERYAEAVHRYASRRCDRDMAEDVVAQVFAVAWRRRCHMPSEEALPWLYGVARRVLSEQRRSDRRRQRLHERMRGERAVEHDEDNGSAPQLDDAALSQGLRLISAADREVLLLTYWEELSPAQVAEAMGCSRATLAVRLHRAHRRLRKQIEAAGQERSQHQTQDHSYIEETEST
ncbi:MAG TPA: sigma-70 family RNA polymerase sigma factor [Solirubrobacteraceae bacterium]|jgi:RNA polymerase sigma-70 factor (ECF subfamily)|nr:sigma-70 family RNA polymerase sigma factor [Solirubrobacteraceae bacterium]